MSDPTAEPQKPLELILARNLLTSLSTPGFLLDGDAAVVFYNEAAAALLGRSFEDAGGWRPTSGRARSARSKRTAARSRSTPWRPPTRSAPAVRPTRASSSARRAGETQPIEASAFPIVANEGGSSGAMILFWPLD